MRVRDVMQPDVGCVTPGEALADLERRLLAERVGGFPVVEGDRIVGVVTRSDVVRAAQVERTQAEEIADYYRDLTGFQGDQDFARDVAHTLGERLEGLRVEEVMSRDLVSIGPDESIDALAKLLVERGFHRLPVVDNGKLVGIVSSMDLVRLVADGRVKPA